MVSCSDAGLDGTEPTAEDTTLSAMESTDLAEARMRCRLFRTNYVLATKRNYEMEILKFNSDFMNDICLVQGATSTFLTTDDDTGTM